MLLVWICTQQQTTNPCLCWPSVIDRILLDVTQGNYANLMEFVICLNISPWQWPTSTSRAAGSGSPLPLSSISCQHKEPSSFQWRGELILNLASPTSWHLHLGMCDVPSYNDCSCPELIRTHPFPPFCWHKLKSTGQTGHTLSRPTLDSDCFALTTIGTPTMPSVWRPGTGWGISDFPQRIVFIIVRCFGGWLLASIGLFRSTLTISPANTTGNFLCSTYFVRVLLVAFDNWLDIV